MQIGAVICGNDFVGGLVGCNDATAKITNTSTSLLTVSGEVVGGKAVGGMIGLNLAPAPARGRYKGDGNQRHALCGRCHRR